MSTKRRVVTRELYCTKKLRVGDEDNHVQFPESYTPVDNGKTLVYNASTQSFVLGDAPINPGDVIDDTQTSLLKTYSSQKINTDFQQLIANDSIIDVSNGALNANVVNTNFLGSDQGFISVVTDISANNNNINSVLEVQANSVKCTVVKPTNPVSSTVISFQGDIDATSHEVKCEKLLIVNNNPGQQGYQLPTYLPTETKFLKSDSTNHTAYWGDAPVIPTIGATNLAANWNWEYNFSFPLNSTNNFTRVLALSISPTNNINNGYIVNNTDDIYQTELGSWGNHKFSVNANIVPNESHDHPLNIYALAFKSNGLAWNYCRHVMTPYELTVLANSGVNGIGVNTLTEIVDRPHSGYLSMYGAGSFTIPEIDKTEYTMYVQTNISSLLHTSGQIIPYGFPINGITESPSINPTFGVYHKIFNINATDEWLFFRSLPTFESPTYADVNTYGARVGSWLVLEATSIVAPFNKVVTCLKISNVDVNVGSITFVMDQNFNDFMYITGGYNTVKHVLYVLNNWQVPLSYVSNPYSITLSGLKTEIYQISPKGEAGEQGIQGLQGIQGIQGPIGPTGATGAQGPAGDPSTLIDDANLLSTSKTLSSFRINQVYQPTINNDTTLTTGTLQTSVLTSTNPSISVNTSLSFTVPSASTISCGTLNSSNVNAGTGTVACSSVVTQQVETNQFKVNTINSTNASINCSKSLVMNSSTAANTSISCGALTSTSLNTSSITSSGPIDSTNGLSTLQNLRSTFYECQSVFTNLTGSFRNGRGQTDGLANRRNVGMFSLLRNTSGTTISAGLARLANTSTTTQPDNTKWKLFYSPNSTIYDQSSSTYDNATLQDGIANAQAAPFECGDLTCGTLSTASRGVANGLASLDGSTKVPVTQIPNFTMNQLSNCNWEENQIVLTMPVTTPTYMTSPLFFRDKLPQGGSGLIMLRVYESGTGNANRHWSRMYQFTYRRSDFSGTNSEGQLFQIGTTQQTGGATYSIGAISLVDDTVVVPQPYAVRLQISNLSTSTSATTMTVKTQFISF